MSPFRPGLMLFLSPEKESWGQVDHLSNPCCKPQVDITSRQPYLTPVPHSRLGVLVPWDKTPGDFFC